MKALSRRPFRRIRPFERLDAPSPGALCTLSSAIWLDVRFREALQSPRVGAESSRSWRISISNSALDVPAHVLPCTEIYIQKKQLQ
jgi:hypothetical protein